MEINAKSQRALIWTFVALSQVYTWSYVYLVGFWPPPSPALDATQVLQMYAQHNMQFRVGVVLMMLSGAFFLPLIIVISAQMARCEKGYPLWSKLQLTTGTLGTWLFAFPPFLWGVAAFSVERDPALTLLMHEFSWLCFVTPPSYFAMQMIPIGIVSFSKDNDVNSPFPRWLGYLTFWMALTGSFGVAAILFKSGPFAWNGLFPFYLPIAVYSVWLVSICITLFGAIKRQEQAAKH